VLVADELERELQRLEDELGSVDYARVVALYSSLMGNVGFAHKLSLITSIVADDFRSRADRLLLKAR